ncbi:hypothetical protein HYV11_01845 [Candidatus Dependentiae bacterium]|nr:hypothetical protein [Candidatus Dependentiae bacterium]
MIMAFTQHPQIMLLLASILLSIFYMLLHKSPENTIILYFWIRLLSYIGFVFIYFFKETIISFNPEALEQFIFDTSYYNIPLYILSAICSVGTYIIFDFLMKSYTIPLILALSQISILIVSIGYFILGDHITLLSSIGIIIIFIGAFTSCFKIISFKNHFFFFEQIDKNLLFWTFIKSLLYSFTALITYVCVSPFNQKTKMILHLLTKYLHPFQCLPIIPIYFNISVQLAMCLFFLLFIHFYQKKAATIIPILFQYVSLILTLSLLHIIYALLLYESYNFISNKNIITAIGQLYLPFTFLGGIFFYNEKKSLNEWLGIGLIVFGNIISLF